MLTAKADLEASKVHITSQITTVKSLEDGIKKAKAGVSQIETVLTGIAGLKTMVPASGNINAATAEPVSYTHLDVYKRQIWVKRGGYEGIFTSYACLYRRCCL